MVRLTHSLIRPAAALAALIALSGCVAYPEGTYGYGGPAYYAPAPTVVVPIAPYRGWYGGGGGGWYRGGYGGGGGWHGGGWR